MWADDTGRRALGGPGSEQRLAALRRRFERASPKGRLSMRARRRLREFGRGLLVIYWVACVAIIAAGLNRAYPHLWPQVRRVLPGPSVEQPFPNCGAAHAAGVYNIPFWSPAYAFEQDRDRDGVACEPPPLMRRL